MVISIVTIITIIFPYFYYAVFLTQLGCAISIINSKDNPDYKVPWLFIVMLIPIVGFMTYFMFYKRNICLKQINMISNINVSLASDDKLALSNCKSENVFAYNLAISVKKLAKTHIYQNNDIKYFPSGEKYFSSLINDLKNANEFIFMEYFIIEEGLFWNSILDILLKKAFDGVEIKIIYDDIGCMSKVASNYYKTLRKYNIKAVLFNKLKLQANNEFNNRSHRKMTIIDGKIAYTGGINLADEYINHIEKFGYFKDVGIRLEGSAVNEMTRLFLIDYSISDYNNNNNLDFNKYYRHHIVLNQGYCIPFGDGPKPMFERQVSKTTIMNLLSMAKSYVYITTPYLIIDNELTTALENAALRGIDVRIITPYIPDKKLIFMMTRNSYKKLMDAGVKIYEYSLGFIHAKTYIIDDMFSIVGTINLDYRSLVHHFENGVLIYNHEVIKDIKNDFNDSINKSFKVDNTNKKENFIKVFLKSILNIFSALL